MSKGYLTFVQNSGDTDYLNMAYLQALTIKTTQNINQYAIVADKETLSQITNKHKKVFDYIIPIPGDDEAADDRWKLRNEWKAYISTPFDETIKLEADMIFPSNIDHWWDIVSKKDICFTTQVLDYRGEVATSRAYRAAFDENKLLNVYNGFYYFRKTDTAKTFFEYAKMIFKNWDIVKTTILKRCENEPASTDLVFAVAAKLLGNDQCYLPGGVPTFTHMKGAINNWAIDANWTHLVYYQFDQTTFTAGFYRQRVPFHYYQKDFATDSVIKHYEDEYERASSV